MRTYPDTRMNGLVTQSAHAQALFDEENFAAAAVALKALLAELRGLGLGSPWAEWALAVALEQQGELLAAYRQVHCALDVDPLCEMHHTTRGVIATRLREQVRQAKQGDPGVPRVVAALRDTNELDSSTTLAWVRHLVHGAQVDEAARVLDAVLLTAPASVDAWRLRAEVARAQGDEPRAASCEAEVASRLAERVAYAIPNTLPGGGS